MNSSEVSETTKDRRVTFVHAVATATDSKDEKDFKRLVRSQAMKNYHAKRREAAAAFDARRSSLPPLLCSAPQESSVGSPLEQLPIELTIDTQTLLYHIYSDPRLSSYRETHMHSDLAEGSKCAASFHQMLSMLAAGLAMLDAGECRNNELYHTTKALELVRIMMSQGNQFVRDELITTVAGLMTQARINFDLDNTIMHMNALEKIIEMRGGFERLPIEKRDCIFKVTVNVATTWDTKPRLAPPQPPINYHLPRRYQGPISELAQLTIHNFRARYPKFKPLTRILEESVRTSIYMARQLSEPTTTTRDLINHVVFQSYKLTATHYENLAIAEALRLSLLIFYTTIWRHVRFHPSLPASLPTTCQLRKLRITLEKLDNEEFEREGLQHLRIFIVAMGFLEALEGDDIAWWTQRWKYEILQSKEESLIIKAEEGSDRDPKAKPLSPILWIDEFHGRRYREIAFRLGSSYVPMGSVREQSIR